MERKTPCAAVLQNADLTDKEKEKAFVCRYCGRRYATRPGLSRHQKISCRIAAKEGGMELLFEHTLQRQIEEQKRLAEEQRSETETLRREVGELSALLRQQLATKDGSAVQQVNIGQQNNTTNTNVHVDARTFVLRSFTSTPEDGGCITVDLRMVRALFVGPSALPALKAWMDKHSRGPLRMTDEIATMAADALVAMIQAIHERCPEQRNIFLNPRRADQVLVFDEAPGCEETDLKSWSVMPLREAILRLCDSLSRQLKEDVFGGTGDRRKMEALCGGPGFDVWHRIEMQDGVGSLPLAWQNSRDDCAEKARPGLSAHLQTLAQRLPQLTEDAVSAQKPAAAVAPEKRAETKKAVAGSEETEDADGEPSIEEKSRASLLRKREFASKR